MSPKVCVGGVMVIVHSHAESDHQGRGLYAGPQPARLALVHFLVGNWKFGEGTEAK